MPVAFLRPPSSSCFPSRVRLVRSAPPPRYGAPPPSGRWLLVPPWRTRSSAGSRENKNNRRSRAAERSERGPRTQDRVGRATRSGGDAPGAGSHEAGRHGLRRALPAPGLECPPLQQPASPAWGTRNRTRPRPGPGQTTAITRAPGSRALLPPPPPRWISA